MRAIQVTETGGPDVLRLAENGSLRITIGGRYPLADAGRAHRTCRAVAPPESSCC
jgi:hypothetical protein